MASNKRLAILVGVNNYPPGIPSLNGAVNDANEICEAFVDSGEFKKDETLWCMTDGEANYDNIMSKLSKAFKYTQDADQIIFYFAGHGFVDEFDDEFYIAPFDVGVDDCAKRGISMSYLKNLTTRTNANTITLLDCCYAGKVAGSTRGGDRDVQIRQTYREAVMGSVGSAGNAGKGKVVFASSGANQKSREVSLPHKQGETGHDHGLFSFYLIQALRGGAANDGRITFDSLRKVVEEGMRQSGKLELGQEPVYNISGGYSGLVILTSSAADFKMASERLAQKVRNNLPPARQHDIQYLCGAVSDTERLRIFDPDYQGLKALIDEIEMECRWHQQSLSTFLLRYRDPLRTEIGDDIWDKRFVDPVSSLSYKLVAGLPNYKRNYLYILEWEVRRQAKEKLIYTLEGVVDSNQIEIFKRQLQVCTQDDPEVSGQAQPPPGGQAQPPPG